MTTVSAARPVMDQLRDSTLEAHKSAEGHPFQKALATGRLAQERYVAYLGQLLLVHRALENGLRRAGAADPSIASVVRGYQYQEPYLLADLKFFGVDPGKVAALPATSKIVAQIEAAAQESALGLLGMHYVLEGSNNGSKFICRAVLRAYGLGPGDGTRYLDPYGENQREYWTLFKADMNAVGFAQAQIDVLIDAAKTMFAVIEAIGAEVGVGA